MKNIILFIAFLFVEQTLFSQQWEKASLNDNMTIRVEKVNAAPLSSTKNMVQQLPGFPIAVPANPSFKNMRNLALADMNGDNIDDIIFAVDNTLYVYTYQGLLWSQTIIGTAVYPPSIGDITGDGFSEIVQVTGESPSNGRIYVFDRFGNILNGWPVNFNNNWIICSPALSDLDGDDKMEIICNERLTNGKVHILKSDGTEFSANWPVTLDGTPSVTPSIADVDGDGQKDIIAYSTKSRYIFGLDGQPKTGFPLTTAPNQSYSYQSPIAVDFDNDLSMEIVGATHGDFPQYYIMNSDTTSYSAWPKNVPDNNWTYSTPTVVKIDNEWKIFMSRPISDESSDMLYGWDQNGNMLNGFPIVKPGGLEGYISVANITNDSDFELIFGSNLKDEDGFGFIHAYKMDGSGELPNFPLRPKGFTFMNGVCIGNINGNGKTNLVALSYDNYFGESPDSTYINVYELDVNYDKSKVLWGTYKGSNTRTGNYEEIAVTKINNHKTDFNIKLFPNPTSDNLRLQLPDNISEVSSIIITDLTGRLVLKMESNNIQKENSFITINVKHLQKGYYNLSLYSPKSKINLGFIKF
ncbi:MAG: FG-GAP-like repeat-containing protein [Bacteroidales bacterium]|nr:FG-GAP-like repeat-containing protein [Bacteroidales bacterium]